MCVLSVRNENPNYEDHMPKPVSPFEGIAWVTGASTGIGRATALKLARMGWRVAVTARNGEALDTLVQEALDGYGKIIPMPADICDRAAIADVVATLERDHGGVALAVLNAGIYEPMHGNQLEYEVFDKMFAVNLTGTINCLVPLQKAMFTRKQGQIAFVSSVAGYGGLPTSAAYGATKAALINLAESLKFDFDKMGILIQVINPGFVDTPATKSNPFEMPMLMPVDEAAEALITGLSRASFEITFPKRFTRIMKILNLLPYRAYFALLNRSTKWKNRALEPTDTVFDESASRKRW